MADIIYGTIKNMPYKDFKVILNSYKKYLTDCNRIDSLSLNEKAAKITLYDNDSFDTIYSFIDMCYALKVSIIVIDWFYVSEKEEIYEKVKEKLEYLNLWEVKLQSGDEEVDAYALSEDFRK